MLNYYIVIKIFLGENMTGKVAKIEVFHFAPFTGLSSYLRIHCVIWGYEQNVMLYRIFLFLCNYITIEK